VPCMGLGGSQGGRGGLYVRIELFRSVRGDQIVVGPMRPTMGLSRPQQPDGVGLASRGILVFCCGLIYRICSILIFYD
jgi:hypothetical protein